MSAWTRGVSFVRLIRRLKNCFSAAVNSVGVKGVSFVEKGGKDFFNNLLSYIKLEVTFGENKANKYFYSSIKSVS